MAFLAAGEGRRLFGFTTPSELRNKFAMCIRQPVGVCAFVTPWNFPMAIPAWKSMAALIAGNSIVIKPATDTPASVVALARVFEEAGTSLRRLQCRHGLGGRRGRPAGRASGREGRVLHRLDRSRPPHLGRVRADFQAAAPGDGRQERDPRHGRRGPRSGRGRGGLGGVRHDRPAVHGVLAPARASGGLRRVPRQARAARAGRSRSATASIRTSRWGPASRRSSARASCGTSRSGRRRARSSSAAERS